MPRNIGVCYAHSIASTAYEGRKISLTGEVQMRQVAAEAINPQIIGLSLYILGGVFVAEKVVNILFT